MTTTETLDTAALYRSHRITVRRQLARRGLHGADLDDAVSESFVAIHRLLPDFEGRASVETWMHAVVWRVATGYLRRAHRRREVMVAELEPCSESEMTQCATASDLHASLDRMGDEARDLVTLHEVGGLSVSELAELTGLARATVAQRLSRARLVLERALSTKSLGKRALATRDRAPSFRDAPHDWGTQRFDACELTRRGLSVSRAGDCVIAVVSVTATAELTGEITGRMLSAADSTPGGISYLSVIEGAPSPPDRAGRQAMAWAATLLRDKLNGVAIVTQSAAMRDLTVSIFNSYLFLSRQALHLRFFDSVERAAAWIAPLSGATAEHIVERVATMRAPRQ